MAQAVHSHHKLYSSFHDRSDHRDEMKKLIALMSKDSDIQGLADARSCLAIGAGDGLAEIEFVKSLIPDLKTFTAVEPDVPSAEHLKRHLQHHLPNVAGVVHEMRVQEYLQDIDDSRKPYDVVLMSHVLYFFDKPDREALFQSLVKDYVRPGGMIVVDHASKKSLDVYHILSLLNPSHMPPSSEDVQQELESAGFTVYRKYGTEFGLKMTDIDETFVGFWSHATRSELTAEEFSAAAKSVTPDHGRLNQSVELIFMSSPAPSA